MLAHAVTPRHRTYCLHRGIPGVSNRHWRSVSSPAYEALGRRRHPSLPESPTELFRIAESIGAEAELSRPFRKKAVQLAAHRPDLRTTFIEYAPIELARPGLLESLEELRSIAPNLDLVLEVHESALTRPSAIGEVKTLLLARNIGLAYDGFGTVASLRWLPCRGGVIVKSPFEEGEVLQAIDASNGAVVWLNRRLSADHEPVRFWRVPVR